VAVTPSETLLEMLRRIGYTSVKDGCAHGDCGTCAVLIDGRAVTACLLFAAQADGREITEMNRQWLRAQIGVVLQDPFLYSRSIRANLMVGRPNAPETEIVEACQDAAIHSSIESFPEGFEAMVGERGVTLSGGQRQRLALARALLKDPPLLVLDDSLSAVDTGTEQEILQALQRRKGRQTTIIIAHRPSSVMNADRILVLDEGRLVQLGDHASLAAMDGPYRRLCEIQGALDESIRADMAAAEAFLANEIAGLSVLSEDEQKAEMQWFIDAAKPFVGVDIKVVS